MSGKNQYPTTFNWQTANPQLTLFPLPANGGQAGSLPSGIVNGAMASTNTIYSNILDISKMDSIFIDLIWSGTPTGTLTIQLSGTGLAFTTIPATSFNPTLVSPSGSAAKIGINIPLIGAKYIMITYVNSSGSGTLNAYAQLKDYN